MERPFEESGEKLVYQAPTDVANCLKQIKEVKSVSRLISLSTKKNTENFPPLKLFFSTPQKTKQINYSDSNF